MAPDVLSTVIEVERDIQQRLDEEKKRSREVIGKASAEAEQELADEERRLAEEEEASLANARTAAEQEAAGIKEAAKREAGRVDLISDDVLRQVLSRHLVRILPGSRS